MATGKNFTFIENINKENNCYKLSPLSNKHLYIFITNIYIYFDTLMDLNQ